MVNACWRFSAGFSTTIASASFSLPKLLRSTLEEYGGSRLRNDKEMKSLGETADNQLYPEYPTPIQVLFDEGTWNINITNQNSSRCPYNVRLPGIGPMLAPKTEKKLIKGSQNIFVRIVA